jgi:hypothetical protein
VLVGRKAIFMPVLRNKLVTLCTGGPWKVKVIHLLLCFWSEFVCVAFVTFNFICFKLLYDVDFNV